MTVPTGIGDLQLTPQSTGWTGHSSGRGRRPSRLSRSWRRNTTSDYSYTWRWRVQQNPLSRCRNSDAHQARNRSQGSRSYQVSRKTWRDLEQQAGKLLPHSSQKDETQEQTIPRQQEPGRQSPSPHPPVAHAWFVVFSPLTASGRGQKWPQAVTRAARGNAWLRAVMATSPTNIWTWMPSPRLIAGRSRNRSCREWSRRGRQRSENRNRPRSDT